MGKISKTQTLKLYKGERGANYELSLFFPTKVTTVQIQNFIKKVNSFPNCETLINDFLKNLASTLNINENSFVVNNKNKNIHHFKEIIIVKHNCQPSILIIKNKIRSTDIFRFVPFTLSPLKNEIKRLNPNKATTQSNIPPKILCPSVQATANTIQILFNNTLLNSEFPDNLKLADVTPVFKKKDPLEKVIIDLSTFYH